MKNLKELITKLDSETGTSTNSQLQILAINMIPDFIPEDRLEAFFQGTTDNFNEPTFQKFIPDYSAFLSAVEKEFWSQYLTQSVA